MIKLSLYDLIEEKNSFINKNAVKFNIKVNTVVLTFQDIKRTECTRVFIGRMSRRDVFLYIYIPTYLFYSLNKNSEFVKDHYVKNVLPSTSLNSIQKSLYPIVLKEYRSLLIDIYEQTKSHVFSEEVKHFIMDGINNYLLDL